MSNDVYGLVFLSALFATIVLFWAIMAWTKVSMRKLDLNEALNNRHLDIEERKLRALLGTNGTDVKGKLVMLHGTGPIPLDEDEYEDN